MCLVGHNLYRFWIISSYFVVFWEKIPNITWLGVRVPLLLTYYMCLCYIKHSFYPNNILSPNNELIRFR